MSKVAENLIKNHVRNGRIELAVKLCIMQNLENGKGFFIGNASYYASSFGISQHQFAGGLSSLKARGEYMPSSDPEYEGHYGYLILPRESA